MRLLTASLMIVGVTLVGGYLFLRHYPYSHYSKWVSGHGYNKYYEIPNYNKIFLSPQGFDKIETYQEDYVQLWREFPIRNSTIPLPTRHPLFQTVPIIEMKVKNTTPQMGVVLLDPSSRELSRIYTLPTSLYQDHTQGQELFKLPYVKKRILGQNVDKLWKDIFSYQINVEPKSVDLMIYELYLLHLRAKLLPKDTVRYGMIKDGEQAMIELESPNKDYTIELVLTQINGSIYSYVLKTEKINPESQKLRAKFLTSITFSPVDESMGRILYTEFKQLNFARQVDQEGMLYLFSAWTQQPDNLELLKEIIFYLERGRGNKQQLKTVYEYAFRKYGKTFTTKMEVDERDDPELVLQRRIEIEEIQNKKDAEANRGVQKPVAPLTPDEKMNMYLKKAKESKGKEKSDMTIH